MGEHVIYILVSGVVLLVGVGLVLKGLWPRRRGETPYCRRCGYNLTGLASQICPECGAELKWRAVVYGERVRGPRRIVAGSVLTLIAGTVLTVAIAHRAGQISLTPYLPSWVLVLQLDDSWQLPTAWRELVKREAGSGLGAWSRRRLINACLDAQGATPVTSPAAFPGWTPALPLTDQRANYLGRCWRMGWLEPGQKERLVRQLIVPAVKVRSRVRAGDEVAWKLVDRPDRLPAGFRIQLSDARVLCDGKEVAPTRPWLARFERMQAAFGDLRFRCRRAGQQEVVVEAMAELYVDPKPMEIDSSAAKPETEPVVRQPVRISARFTGIPADEPDIKLVPDPSMKETIDWDRQPVRLLMHTTPYGERFAIVQWNTSAWRPGCRLPVDVACKVLARVDGQEYEVGEATGRKGGVLCPVDRKHYGGPVADKVDLVLRTSEEVARRTMDMFEIWDGEIVYTDVPVSSSGTVSSRAVE